MRFVFRPGGRGLETVSGHLEKAVFEALWEAGEITGRGLYEKVARGGKPAYTTVLTVLDRMVKKGLVRRAKGDGAYLFSAALSRDELERRIASSVVQGLVSLAPVAAIATFADVVSGLPEAERRRFLALVEEKRKGEPA